MILCNNMEEKNWYEGSIDSVIIVKFMIEYDKFEKEVKRIFQEQIKHVEHKNKSILYFYYGCTVGNEWRIDYDNRSIERSNHRKYDDNEMFKSLSLDKINKFLRKERIIQCFNFEIDSLQTKMVAYTFYDSCEKLTKMRNHLAHSISQITEFKGDVFIELLIDNKIEEYIYEWIDKSIPIHDLTHMSKIICSNIIYMNRLRQELHTKLAN